MACGTTMKEYQVLGIAAHSLLVGFFVVSMGLRIFHSLTEKTWVSEEA